MYSEHFPKRGRIFQMHGIFQLGGVARGGSKGGAVVRALTSHQCGLGSNPSVEAICGLSLLVFLWVLRFSPLPKNQHFQIPFQSGTHMSASWVNKLQYYNYKAVCS